MEPRQTIERYFHPNTLTTLRILLVPVLILMGSWSFSPAIRLGVCLVFALAVLTDFLDGYIAAKYRLTTSLGIFLDPVADKILVSSCLVMLTSQGKIPAWLTCVLIGREFAVSGLRSIAAQRTLIIPASRLAKYKTAFQMAGIFCLFFPLEYLDSMGMVFLWIGLVLSLWSGWLYGRSLINEVI